MFGPPPPRWQSVTANRAPHRASTVDSGGTNPSRSARRRRTCAAARSHDHRDVHMNAQLVVGPPRSCRYSRPRRGSPAQLEAARHRRRRPPRRVDRASHWRALAPSALAASPSQARSAHAHTLGTRPPVTPTTTRLRLRRPPWEQCPPASTRRHAAGPAPVQWLVPGRRPRARLTRARTQRTVRSRGGHRTEPRRARRPAC